MENEYSGRKIAIFADVHGLIQPLEAVLEECKKEGISEIYSLGDNIGDGPNPVEVIKILEEYGVKSVRGNAEEYVVYGIEPFIYLQNNYNKGCNALWTIKKVKPVLNFIEKYPISIDLEIGGKKVALCHFIGDVRSYFPETNTWNFQAQQEQGKNGFNIFEQVNSVYDKKRKKDRYEQLLKLYGEMDSRTRIAKSEIDEPLFNGKRPTEYDAIFQGHVHFKSKEASCKTMLYTVRGLECGFTQIMQNNINLSYDDKKEHGYQAYYIVVEEKNNNKGFDVRERYINFDRIAMKNSIINSDNYEFSPSKKFTEIDEIDILTKES